MRLSHPTSKYPDILAFAKANPLPTTVVGLADGLMDVATILVTCREGSSRWSSLDMHFIYGGKASPYPGAFLSNPALLPNTVSVHDFGTSMGSLTAGAFFGYPHYQEDSLGQALLLPAFSPRTRKPQLHAKFYAQALIHLRDAGLISSASLSGEVTLEEAAQGGVPSDVFRYASFHMVLEARHIASCRRLRTDLAARAIELALSDDKQGLFSDAVRARLCSLVIDLASTGALDGGSERLDARTLRL